MFLSVVATLLLVHCSFAHGESHLVCKTMNDIFDSGNPSGDLGRREVQGPTGKRGPQGLKGERGGIGQKGMKGDEGMVNYANVNATMQGYMKDVFERLEALELEAMRTKQVVEAACPMWIEGSCFTLVKDKTYTVEQAVKVCSRRSSKLADITTESTLDMLMKRIRLDYSDSGSSIMDMWLGLTITPSTGQVALSDGRNAPYVKWDDGYPSTSSANTAMILRVNANRMSTDQYFWNYAPQQLRYALCQMND